jgi:uncharacterized protein YlaI
MQYIPIPINKIDKEVNKQICEAIDCFNEATLEVKIDVGKFGKISLFLCKNCIPKFSVKGG